MSATKMSKRAACAVAASALLAATTVTAISPSQALAIDETRTFTWANGSPQPEIPQTITGADGREYKLTSQTQPQQTEAPQTTSQQFTRTESRQIGADQLGQVSSMMPESVPINEDGYSGTIPRVAIDTTPVYRTESNRITSTAYAYGDTADAAKAALPRTINRNGRILTLSDSKVEEARKDTAGNVILYKAEGTYSVEAPRQVLDHYDVVARYSGTLRRLVNGGDWTVQATYSAEDLPSDQTDENSNSNENENSNEITMMPPMDMNGNTIDESELDDYSSNGDESDEQPQDEDESPNIPILPLAVGAGAVVLGGAAAGVMVARKRKAAKSAVMAQSGLDDSDGLMMDDMGAFAGSMGLDGEYGFGEGEGNARSEMVIIEDPQCQLIELIAIEVEDEDGSISYEYDQKPKADLEIEPSCVADIPTVIYFPALEDADGNRIDFVPTPGAQYWIAIDEETVQKVPNKDIIIASDDEKEIYRGSLIEFDGELTDQFQLDVERMVSVVNGTAAEDEVVDVSAELEGYDEIAEEAMRHASRRAPRADAFQLDEYGDLDELEELDTSVFDDDEDLGEDFASALEALSGDDDGGFDEGLEFADSSIDKMFDEASAAPVDPFAAYGIGMDDPYADRFDSEFEREMDDFEYDPELDPDVDEFDFEEDFQQGVIEPETELVDDGDLLGDDLDDLDFDDIVDIDDVEVISDEPVGKRKDIRDFQDLLNSI